MAYDHYTLLAPANDASRLYKRMSSRQWIMAGLFVVFVGTVAIQAAGVVTWSRRREMVSERPPSTEHTAQVDLPWMETASSLNFPHPTTLARDNLRNDSYYLTSFPVAGFTNKVIAYMHLMHLAFLSNRIPIVPPMLPPGWVPVDAGMVPFGELFNLTNVRAAVRRPILEWTDVKTIPRDAFIEADFSPTDPTVEQFGCWSTRARKFPVPVPVTGAENVLRIDLSRTRVPDFAYLNKSDPGDFHTTFPALSTIVWPKHPHPSTRNVPLLQASRLNSTRRPDEHLACFDVLYFVSSGVKAYEFENRWSPAWNTVGTHMKFTQRLVDLTMEYLRRALKLSEGEAIPPMVTIHIRRNDFKFKCEDGQTPPCFMPLHRYAKALDDVRKELAETRKINPTRVFVTSDEVDNSFWEEISSYGWNFFNHTEERTVERYGHWHPLLIDKVALSMGVGFIGTKPSTFSVLNAMRVEDWNNGVTRMLDYYAKA